MRPIPEGILNALRGLPLIRFALMLGGGMVSTAGAGWLITLLGYGRWFNSEATAVARINGLTMLGIGCLVLIGIVLVALAWGRLDKLSLNVGCNSVDLDFEDEKPDVVTTTTTKVKP